MQKKKLKLSLLFISICGILGFFILHHSGKKNQIEETWVRTVKIVPKALPIEVHAIGSLTAKSIEITPESAGHVAKIHFQDGQQVQMGQLLVQLEDGSYKAQYDSALAKLIYDERDYNRKKLLGKRGAIALQAIEQAEAELKEQQARLREIKFMISQMQLTAPFAGVVGKCKVNVGDYVATGQNIVTLSNISRLRVEYSVPERNFPLLRIGQKISLTSAAYPGKTFTGKVMFISPNIDSNTRTISLYAEINNDPPLLAAGMFVEIIHFLGTQKETLMLPARSLVPVLGGEQVYKVINGRAYSTSVVVGARDKDKVQILQGLKAGEVVITDGQFKVKDGMAVRAVLDNEKA